MDLEKGSYRDWFASLDNFRPIAIEREAVQRG
jgi:hypothetical protein